MSVVAYLGLGSNLGDRRAALREAVARLGEWVVVEAVSGVYETDPVGYEDQPRFLNAVVRCRAALEPEEWVATCLHVEREMGRIRSFPNAPRRIDLDVLLVGDRVVDAPGVQVPHPRMPDRAFVLVPLLELDPELVDPRTGRPLAEWVENARAGAGPMERVLNGEELLDDDEG